MKKKTVLQKDVIFEGNIKSPDVNWYNVRKDFTQFVIK